MIVISIIPSVVNPTQWLIHNYNICQENEQATKQWTGQKATSLSNAQSYFFSVFIGYFDS